MAASQLPRHDFAPAWLKLPNNENSAWRQGTGDRLFYQPAGGERSVGRQSRSNAIARGALAYDDVVSQPHAFHHQPQQFARQRLYSSEDYECTLNGVGPRSSSRHGHNSRSHLQQVNGLYSDQQSLGYVNRHTSIVNGSHTSSKKPQRPKDGRSVSVSDNGSGQGRKMESNKAATSNSTSVPMLDDEFPSLNGDTANENSKPTSSKVMSVWDSPSRQSKNLSRSSNSSTEAGHKALILKTGSAKRWAGQSSAGTTKLTSGTRDGVKEIQAPGEGLNACLVTHPKNIGDKKSNFLRSLRHESHESDSELNGFEASGSWPTSPGLDYDKVPVFGDATTNSNCCDNMSDQNFTEGLLNCTPIEQTLSSSHEAEQRLLREMGWQETDEEVYEITEADVLEFENLRRRLQVNCSPAVKSRNGFGHELPARLMSFPVLIDDVLPDLDPDSDDLSESSSDDNDDGVTKKAS